MYDASESRRKIAPSAGKLDRLFFEDCTHGICGRLPVKGSLSGEHLVKDRAQAEDIGAMVQGLSAYLLRRHVTYGPQHHARLGDADRRHRTLRSGSAGADQFGQPEIKNFDYPVAREKKIFRFEVP